jgi:hypothetical protein
MSTSKSSEALIDLKKGKGDGLPEAVALSDFYANIGVYFIK